MPYCTMLYNIVMSDHRLSIIPSNEKSGFTG